MEYNKNNFDKEAYAEARKQEMEEISAKLEKGVKEVFEGEGYKNYLRFCAKMPRYSINNQLLIMMQNPDATMCQSYSGCKEMGRSVKKGEKGIRILAPAPYKKEMEKQKIDENGKLVFNAQGDPVIENVEVKMMGFKAASTFDISQTEGEPVPTLAVEELTGRVDGYDTLMEAIKQAVEIPIAFEDIQSGAKGYYSVSEEELAGLDLPFDKGEQRDKGEAPRKEKGSIKDKLAKGEEKKAEAGKAKEAKDGAMKGAAGKETAAKSKEPVIA